MLSRINIENYALIEHLDMELHPGFTVITGETGAGKSILLGALSMVLGKRADTRVLLNKSRKCVVEASFSLERYDLKEFFADNDLDYDRITILRRELNPQGKSRSFINDTPVNLNVLKDLGDKLVDIYSQHGLLALREPEYQLSLIDNFAGLTNDTQEIFRLYHELSGLRDHLEEMRSQERDAGRELDYFQFLLDEIEQFNPESGEQERLEENRKIWTHAEEIKTALYQASERLTGDESNITAELRTHLRSLERISGYHTMIREIHDRLQSAILELEDLARETEMIYHETDFDPRQLEEVNERLDQLYKLQQKHRVETVEGLITIKEELAGKLDGITSLADEIRKLESTIQARSKELKEKALKLSEARLSILPDMEKDILKILVATGMPEAKVKISHERLDEPGIRGMDSFTFLFTANPGVAAQDLADVASGGELSRLMLAVKSLISEKNLLPTIIFDEIDSGISGDVSGKVGEVMADLARKMQVIAITHLPQIAGKGHHHFRVYKQFSDKSTRTLIEPVEGEQRLTEITKMFSGEDHSDTARKAAKEFLKN